MAGSIAEITDGKHHRHFDQDADYSGQRGPRVGAEEGNGDGYSEFKEVAGPD